MRLKPQIGPIRRTDIAMDQSRNSNKKNDPMSPLLRSSLAAVFAASCLFAVLPAMAQGGDTKAADKPGDKPAQAQPADADAQRRIDEFAEAARQVSGPAGNAECVWLGRRVIRWLYGDDLDTAVRHLDLYDRFGCPGPHIQSAFRCLLRQSANLDPKDPKTNPALNSRVHSCWLNPVAANAAATNPAAPVAAQPAAPNITQGAASGSAASGSGSNQPGAPKPGGTPGR
jgi:septal ring-binding cell division protein DamX